MSARGRHAGWATGTGMSSACGHQTRGVDRTRAGATGPDADTGRTTETDVSSARVGRESQTQSSPRRSASAVGTRTGARERPLARAVTHRCRGVCTHFQIVMKALNTFRKERGRHATKRGGRMRLPPPQIDTDRNLRARLPESPHIDVTGCATRKSEDTLTPSRPRRSR